MYTLLFEILDAGEARPRKRYLFCNDRKYPALVTALTLERARGLAGLLAHPEIVVTIVDYAGAIETYERIETETPSRETLTNGHPRTYESGVPVFITWPTNLATVPASA
jgi:hypothetical protein